MKRALWGTIAMLQLAGGLAAGGPAADVDGHPDVSGAGASAPVGAMSAGSAVASAQQRPAVLDLWSEGRVAFGVFVPDERPREERGRGGGQRQPARYTAAGGERLARNPLYDFLFLNLEGSYDGTAVSAIVAGIRAAGAVGRVALLVRIPPIERDGLEVTRERVEEVLAAGADGVVFPHVRGPEEAAQALSLLHDAGAATWSPSHPQGDKIAMIMVEDPESLERVAETAQLPGISVLACGIGSLRGALGGDREAAEAGNQEVLAQARQMGIPDMLTAGVDDVEQRVREGFLALLMQGADADAAIEIGRAAAGR
jgi:citrate lyase beta subunit